MTAMAVETALRQGRDVPEPPAPAPVPQGPLFEDLLPPDQWMSLAAAVRRRFSRHLDGASSIVYRGEIVEARASLAGRVLAQLARLVGGPLPTSFDAGMPATVIVMPVAGRHAQSWTRLYARRGRLPQAIHSMKRFAGPTGLEEYLGHGLGIALRLEVRDGVLLFVSRHYFVELLGRRLRLPRLLEPGRLEISHTELGGGRFAFGLRLVHGLLGELMRQIAVFEDPAPEA